MSICICPNRDDHCSPHFGTGGALVVDSLGTHYLLSAAHVMTLVGADVIQPSATHGGHNHVKKRLPGAKGSKPVFQFTPPRDNVGGVVRIAAAGVDAAIAECTMATPVQIGIGAVQTAVPAIIGLPVQKSGARTGVTEGECVADSVHIQPKLLKRYFSVYIGKFKGWKSNTNMQGLFLVDPGTFGDGGDSGSLIVAGGSSTAAKDFLTKHAIQARSAVGLLIGFVNTSNGPLIVGQGIDTCLAPLKVVLVL